MAPLSVEREEEPQGGPTHVLATLCGAGRQLGVLEAWIPSRKSCLREEAPGSP